ncbi:MAG TPA: N-acetylmuramoyl-L-alanine amidase [Cellulomonadaceae bacterium]|nr:N-acetylmuramoyl-L-alanine amidase [Cellulomonadaceae bacterium]
MTEPLIYPKAVWRPVPSHGGPMVAQLGLVEHITTNDFSPYNFFADPNDQASSDYWIAADGLVEQYVDARMRAWAEAAGNGRWNSAEVSGKPGTLKTPAQCEALADLLAWGHLHPDLKWPLVPSDSPDTPGVGWHGMGGQAWGGHLYCPGDQRVEQTRRIVIPRALQLAGVTPPPAPTPQEEEDVKYLIKKAGDPKVYVTDLITRRHVRDQADEGILTRIGHGKAIDPNVYTVPDGFVEAIREVSP